MYWMCLLFYSPIFIFTGCEECHLNHQRILHAYETCQTVVSKEKTNSLKEKEKENSKAERFIDYLLLQSY